MSCNVTEKYTRANRRNRLAKPNPELGSRNNNTCNVVEMTPLSNSIMESRIKPLHYFMGGHDSAQNTNPSPTPSAGLDRSYYVEEHLEVECPKRFNLSPSVKSLVKKNVATFDAGFRTEIEPLWAFNLQMLLDIVTPIKPSAGSRARLRVGFCQSVSPIGTGILLCYVTTHSDSSPAGTEP
nr:MND1-interacting protein 1-like [Ipomoea trifida]